MDKKAQICCHSSCIPTLNSEYKPWESGSLKKPSGIEWTGCWAWQMQQEQGCADFITVLSLRSHNCKIPHWSWVYGVFLRGTYTWEERSAQKEILQNTKLNLVLGLGPNMRLLIFSNFNWRALLRHSFRVDYLWFIMLLPLHQLHQSWFSGGDVPNCCCFSISQCVQTTSLCCGGGAELIHSACLTALCLQLCLKCAIISISVKIH